MPMRSFHERCLFGVQIFVKRRRCPITRKSDAASPSPYIRSRGEGEAAVQAAFPGVVIIRPAVMFAPDDDFLRTILRLLRVLPAYPIFGDGRTRLQPVYADDVAAAITQLLRQSKKPYPIYETPNQG